MLAEELASENSEAYIPDSLREALFERVSHMFQTS